MLVLALDTTTSGSSRALWRDGAVLREEGDAEARQQAERLPGDLVALLDGAGVTLAEIDLFAVATGPGSFTGLRIGIAAMQGLAFATGKPLIGVSALEALAHSAGGAPASIATWVDAWRGEVYAALYADGREVMAPVVARPADLLPRIGPGPTLFIGDGAVTSAALIVDTLGPAAQVADPTPFLAATIARLAAGTARAMHERGEPLPPPHAIRPLYVRRPDAELARDAHR